MPMKSFLTDIAERSAGYLSGLAHRSVAPTEAAVDGLACLDGPLPLVGTEDHEIIAMLDQIASPATIASAGGRYFGYVTGGALPATLGASWLATAWDQNGFSATSSPIAAKIEEIALRWLIDLFGFPETTGGAFVTGATMANFSCLAAARHRVLAACDWDVDERGLYGAPPITVVVGDEAHASLIKALGMLGMGRANVHRVAVNAQGAMDAKAMPAISGLTIVCLQAGNVNTGAFDPAPDIIAKAQAGGAWVHVDGAFGVWAATAPARAHLMNDYALADSWATDAHKWLNVPYDGGIALTRDAQALRAAMSIKASYLHAGQDRDPFDFTPECSRRARGLEVWTALKSLGREGLAEMIERNCRLAAIFADGLTKAGFEVLNDVVLNQVLVSFGDAETTERIIAAIQMDGTCWCGGTVWQGRTAMRISVSSWATTDEDVERSLAAMIDCAKRNT